MDNKSFQEIKNRSLFARLKRLFSNEIIVRNIGGKKLKVVDVNSAAYATDRNSLRDRFNRLRVSASDNYSRDFNLAFQRNRVEIFRDYDCITGDTIIPLPSNKSITIKELAEQYKDNPEERFDVYSFDLETDYPIIGKAFHPRSKGIQNIYKITFSTGGVLRATNDHLILMKCGTYKPVKNLQVNDSVLCNRHITNTVVSVEPDGSEEVFDLSVDTYHNFLTSECYIHNCMDMDPILHSALDIYADESTTQNEYGNVLQVYSSDEAIKETLENLFYDILNVEYNLWSWVRSLVKYGDFYLRLFISPEYGVYLVKPYSAYHVSRIENTDLSNRNIVKFQVTIPEGNRLEELHNYEMVHFRLISDSNFLPQGLSVLEGARRIWKQLCLAQGSTVWTSDGYKYIEDIKPNDTVYTFNIKTKCLEKSNVKIQKCTGKQVQTVTIKTKNRCFTVTPSHKMLVKTSKGELVYKEAKDILFDNNQTLDSLVFPSIKDGSNSRHIDVYEYNRLIRSYVKDSCYAKSSGEQLRSTIKIQEKQNEKLSVPSWVFTMSKKVRKEFLNGLFDTTNNVTNNTLYVLNKSFANQIKTLCEMTGITCSDINISKINNKEYYILHVNFKDEYDLKYECVIDVSTNNQLKDVYNMTVDHPDHNYIVNGAVSSNCLMEDAMLIHRIMRAPEKRIFKIDVGNLPPNEIDNHITRVMNTMKKVPYVDQQTGDYNLRFNLQNMVDDFYLPIRGGDSGTNIETLGGLNWTGTDDVEYLRNKMMAALKMSKATLGYDENTSGKATLSALDIRFGRTVQRIQRFVLSGLKEIAIVHLYSQGFRDERLVDFNLQLTNPSTVFIKEQLEIFSEKIDVASKMIDSKVLSKKWVYENIFDLSEQEIIENQKEMVDDAKSNYRFLQIEEEGVDPVIKFLKTKQKGTSDSDDEFDDSGVFDSQPDLGGGGSSPDIDDDMTPDTPDEIDEPTGGEGEEDKETSLSEVSPKQYKKYQFKPTTIKNKIRKSKEKKKAWDKNRDQTGRKDASKYPFGEDPLGDLENKRKIKLSEKSNVKQQKSVYNETHKYETNRMKRELTSLLNMYNEDPKKILSEDLSTKISYMDEKILE